MTDWGFGPLSWTPEFAWGMANPDGEPSTRRAAIHDLYAVAAEHWTASGARAHWVSVLADDREAVEAFTWLGFGHQVVNAVRDWRRSSLDPASPCEPRSTADVVVLQRARGRCRAPPAIADVLPLAPARSVEEQRRRIEDSGRAVLLTEAEGQVIGHLLVGPVADDVAAIVQDPGTASITGAFVLPERRRSGVAETLLAAAVDWARENGYERIGVDFESANTLASRCWLRYFTPVTFAMVRRLAGP